MSEPDRPAQGGSPPKRDGSARAARRVVSDQLPLYRIAYQESQRTLDDQQDELQGMRTRAVQFTAFVGAATAFLVGTGLKATSRDAAFYTLAIIASIFSVALIALLFALLKPSKKKLWNYRLSAKELITGWIETDVPPPSEAHFVRALAETYDTMQRENEGLLGRLRNIYQSLIAVGAVQIIFWAALVWAKG